MYKFINNNILILLFIFSVFYYLCTYNSKIIEKMANTTLTTPLQTLNQVITSMTTPSQQLLSLEFDTVDIIGSMKTGNTLKIGTITLKDEGGELVIDKPITSTKATIGDWYILENKMGIDKKCDILIDKKEVKIMDGITKQNKNIITKSIQTKKITAPLNNNNINDVLTINAELLTTPEMESTATMYGMLSNAGMAIANKPTKKNARLKLNYNDILYRGIEVGSISLKDYYQNKGKDLRYIDLRGTY